MDWICQLGDGYMLCLDSNRLKAVYTGYPYPDTEKSQMEMLYGIYMGAGYSGSLEDFRLLYPVYVASLSEYFQSRVIPEEGLSVLDAFMPLQGIKNCACVYWDGSVAAYKVNIDCVPEAFVASFATMPKSEAVWIRWGYFVIPLQCMWWFWGLPLLPKGYRDKYGLCKIVEGLVNVVCFSEDYVWEHPPMDLLCGNGLNSVRLVYGVLPRLGVCDEIISLVVRMFSSQKEMKAVRNAQIYKITWSRFIWQLSMLDFLQEYGSAVMSDVTEIALFLTLRELQLFTNKIWKNFFWPSIKVEMHLPLVKQALSYKFEKFENSFDMGWLSLLVTVEENDISFSLDKVFDRVICEYCTSKMQAVSGIDCSEVLTVAFPGMSAADLAKKVLFSGSKVTFDVSSRVLPRKLPSGVSNVLALLCGASLVYYNYNLVDSVLLFSNLFQWIPKCLLDSFDFEGFAVKYSKELLLSCITAVRFDSNLAFSEVSWDELARSLLSAYMAEALKIRLATEEECTNCHCNNKRFVIALEWR